MNKTPTLKPCRCGFQLSADNIACDEHLKMHSKYIRELIDGKKEKRT